MNDKNQFIANRDMIMKMKINNEKYYDVSKVKSYQAFMNIIMGGRGTGKTTQLLIDALNRNKKYGEEFIYLRRYKSETILQKELLDNKVENVKFVGDGNNGGQWKIKNHRLGYLIALSVQQLYKSVNFDNVTTIIYDEAIIQPGQPIRYLNDEITVLLEFISTVFRNRQNVHIYILGNNLDFFNPYMAYFKVKPFSNIYYDKDRDLFLQYYKHSEKLMVEESKSPLFRLTKNTTYHDYHYNNEILLDEKVETSSIKSSDRLWFVLKINEYYLNIYLRSDGRFLVDTVKKDISQDNGCNMYIMLSSQEINYWDMKCFRDSKFRDAIMYKYYKNSIDYTSQEGLALMNMVIELI